MLNTDLIYIILIIVLALTVCALIAVLRLDEEPDANSSDPIVICDWVYRDDKGNLFVVTSADVCDNYSLLIEEYGLNYPYIRDHVFLVSATPITEG